MFHLLLSNIAFIQDFSKGKFSHTGLIPGKLDPQTHRLLTFKNFPDHHLFPSSLSLCWPFL